MREMKTTYRRNPRVEATAMKAESLLFDPETNKFCLLNETSALVWDRLQQPTTTHQLVDFVCEHFGEAERSKVETDIGLLLRRLEGLALVVAA